MENEEPKLTAKQKQFCNEYIIDLNATQAAIRSGYSEKTACAIGTENLRKPNIQNYIAGLQKETSERNKITIDECVTLLSKMARFDLLDLLDDNGCIKKLSDIPEHARLSIESLEIDEMRIGEMKVGETKKIKLSNRRGNIVELMKHLGGYEKHNEQKKPQIDLSKLSDDVLDALINASS